MSLATIFVIVVLAVAGGLAIALESGALGKYARSAVLGFVLLAGAGIVLFMMSDASGKIEWGEQAAKIERDTGKKKEIAREGEDDGGEVVESAGAGKDGATNANGQEGDDEQEAAQSEPEPEHETFQDCDVCPVMVVVQQGSFAMGAPDEEHGARQFEGPVRDVELARNFAVSKMEITRAQYDAFVKETSFASSSSCMIGPAMNAGASYMKPGMRQDDADPVVCVDWIDAQYYVKWLTKKTGNNYRLLSEAEWEYTARGGTKTPYATGDGVSVEEANFKNTWKQTQPTGSYPENAFGIKDMHGNVAEWVADCWHDTLKGAPLDHKPWLAVDGGGENCKSRVIRGGAWNSDITEIRSASREYETKSIARNTIGLRVAKQL